MRLVHEPHGRALGSGRPPLLVSVCMAFVLSTFILAALPATRAAAAAPSAWAKLDLASTPSGTAAGAFAYDPATSSAVLFTTSGQTWTFDGTWTHVSPAHSPSSRFGAGMAYSPTTGRVVLFGGATGSCCPQTVFADTWTWDGTDWTHQSPAHSPPGRWYPAMATDTVHSAVVLFGGADSGLQEHNDTWAWNGTDWSNPIPDNSPGSPAKRNNASMTFDPAGNRLVLFGGLGDGGEVQDTWGWDGSAWSSLSPAHHPGPRQGATFSYDPLAQRGVLFGGYCCGISQSKNLDETWIWTGSDWTDATPADVSARPPAIEDPLSAYVPASRAVVMLDGTTDWAYRLAYPTFNWRNSYAVGPYYGRAGAAAAYDPRIGKVVMFGGDYISGGIHSYLDETKLWNGTSWEQGCYSPICGPHARTDASMAFDRATGQLVLFGGSYKTSSGSAVTVLNDTWTYDPVAQSWNQVATGANTPPARLVPSVAYDASSGKVLLFGGLTGAGTVLADTWSFNGTGWTQITTTPAQTPPARYQAAMTYDPSLNAVLLSAGAGLNDTWMWTGIGWSLLSPAHAPDPGAARMDYDAATGSVILLKDGSTTVWSWSGGDRHSSSPAYSPGTKDKPAVAFDRATGDMFFFGGVAGSTYPTTTYLGAPENETTPPTLSVSHTVNGSNGYDVSSPVTLAISASDAYSGLAGAPTCTDNGSNLPVAGSAPNFSAQVSGEGTHAIACSVSDNANNPAAATDTVKIDTVAPYPIGFTIPTATDGAFTLTFSEPVAGLSALNLTIGGDFVTHVTCISTPTPEGLCDTWSFHVLHPVVPGAFSYVYIAPLYGPTPWDVAGNVVANTGGGFRLTEISVADQAFHQTWARIADAGALGGSFVQELSQGATFSYSFTGTSLTWYTVKGPDQGKAKVRITNPGGTAVTATVDGYAPSTTDQVPVTFSGLTNAKHTATITVLYRKRTAASSYFVSIDAFSVNGGPPKVTPKGVAKWATIPEGPTGLFAYSGLPTASCSMTFYGTGVAALLRYGPTEGKAQVFVDGIKTATIDLYAPNYTWAGSPVPLATGLASGTHTVKIVVSANKNPASVGTGVVLAEIDVA